MAASIWLSNQELIYLAMACRVAANVDRREAEACSSLVVKEIHLNSAISYDEMAELLEGFRTDLKR